jgi:hypothetical protein
VDSAAAFERWYMSDEATGLRGAAMARVRVKYAQTEVCGRLLRTRGARPNLSCLQATARRAGERAAAKRVRRVRAASDKAAVRSAAISKALVVRPGACVCALRPRGDR